MTYIICKVDLRSLRLRIAGLERESERICVCLERRRREMRKKGLTVYIKKFLTDRVRRKSVRIFYFDASRKIRRCLFFWGKFQFPTNIPFSSKIRRNISFSSEIRWKYFIFVGNFRRITYWGFEFLTNFLRIFFYENFLRNFLGNCWRIS